MQDKKILITGGAGDIGTIICQHFHKLGAKVIAADYDKDRLAEWQLEQKNLGFDFETAQVDVAQFESCEKMASKVGSIDILVNAAGIIRDVTLKNMSPEAWEQVLRTDLDSVFNVTRQFINGMIEQKYGRIINIASVSGQKGQVGQVNYAAAKSGIFGFTKSLAQEVAKHGVTVNAISPGFVESRMVDSIPEKVRKKLISQIPVKRLAQPEEVAWCIEFLASEKSGFITGVNLPVNGGFYM